MDIELKTLKRVITAKKISQVGTTLSTNPVRSREYELSSNQIIPIT